MTQYKSWGNLPATDHKTVFKQDWRNNPLPENIENCIAYGNGRSYGDVALNANGTLLDTSNLNRFIDFDREVGILRCESGVLVADILDLIAPAGWFLPVVPGTQQITVGGAVANDVHGKNHHQQGSFGCHVKQLQLLRSDQKRYTCSLEENPELFAATIGGVGLTGLIVWVEIQLINIPGTQLVTEDIQFADLEEFFELSQTSNQDWEYTVAWLDCAASGKNLGRGIFSRGNFSSDSFSTTDSNKISHSKITLGMPFYPPFSLINTLSVKLFNTLYYRKAAHRVVKKQHYAPFFFPLDGIQYWNRMYGKNGFYQFQCVLPPQQAATVLQQMLETISQSGEASFLAVLKEFGNKPSPGLLSFPRKGYTLALDFPNRGDKTRQLIASLTKQVNRCDGAIYPAKDALMGQEDFLHYYPQAEQFKTYIDPKFNSSFKRRVAL